MIDLVPEWSQTPRSTRIEPPCLRAWNRIHQSDRVRMSRSIEYIVYATSFDDLTLAQYVDAFNDLTQNREIVGDEQIADPQV